MFPFGLLLIYLLSTLLSMVVLYFWKHRRYYYLGIKLPGQTLNYFRLVLSTVFLVSLETLPHTMKKYYDKERLKYSSITKFWYGWRLLLVIGDPDIIQKIFRTQLQKDDVVYTLAKPFTNGPSLFHETWIAKWENHRKIISHAAFTPSVLKSYVTIFHEEANNVLKRTISYMYNMI
uniref:Cytochrome P450 n=1 Tax=Cacopsylla melanoneura TaxID=428564 RepID=A0A8D8Q8J0_9HEMI